MTTATADLLRTLHGTRTVVELGRIVQAGGTVLRATGLRARIGQQCRIFEPGSAPDAEGLVAEVIGFAGNEAILAPYGPLQGVAVGAATHCSAA
jgi:type III secretion protein N (ATPase)